MATEDRPVCYLDHAGIGLVRPAARAAMHRAVDEVLARGSAAYQQFFTARTQAREAAARLFACDPDEVALVANTSTGLQLVADGLAWRPGDEVVVCERDFPANVQPWRRLAGRGVALRWVPMRDGGYRLADLDAVLGPATRLVAVSHVSFLTGFRLDLDAVCERAAGYQALVCVDAVQSAGVLPVDLSRTPVDFLAAGGHKWLGAPPGTGVFFCRRARLDLLALAPLGWFGYAGSDEIFGQGEGRLRYELPPRAAARRFEGGMLNFVGIAGLAAALAETEQVGVAAIWDRVAALTGHLREGLAERGYEVTGPIDASTGSGIVSFRAGPTPDDGQRLHAELVAAGCALSYPEGLLRLSPHYWTTDDEVDRFLTVLPPSFAA